VAEQHQMAFLDNLGDSRLFSYLLHFTIGHTSLAPAYTKDASLQHSTF